MLSSHNFYQCPVPGHICLKGTQMAPKQPTPQCGPFANSYLLGSVSFP